MGDLSMDARVLHTATFANGPAFTLTIGGEGAQSVLSPRAAEAMAELIQGDYVTAKQISAGGRMRYAATGKTCPRLSQKMMDQHGRWSLTSRTSSTSDGEG